MTIKPAPKNKKPATRKPAPKPAPKPAAQAGPKPGPAASSSASAPSGPDRELAARDMKRGLGGGGGFLWALLALAVVAGAGAATMDVWMPKLAETLTAYQAPRVDPRLAPVALRVQALEKELQAQQVRETAHETARETAMAAARTPPPPVEDIKEIVRRLTKMETRLAALRKMVGATRPPDEARTAGESLQRLSGRLQSLERNRKEVDAILKRIAATDRSLPDDKKKKPETEVVTGGRELMAATRELNRLIENNRPFADVLAQVKRLAGADKDMAVNIAVLEPLAPSGVWTLDRLRREFAATAAAILQAKPLPSEPSEPLRAGTGWWDKAINKLAAMVSLRRQGEQEEKNATADRDRPRLVAAAEKALGENNISAAIEALEVLSGPPAAAARAWLDQARGRETAEKAAVALNLFALTRLAAAAAKPPEKAPAVKAPEVTAEPEKAAPEKAEE